MYTTHWSSHEKNFHSRDLLQRWSQNLSTGSSLTMRYEQWPEFLMILKLAFRLFMCFGSAGESYRSQFCSWVTSVGSVEAVVWAEPCRMLQVLTGTGAAGNSCQSWPIEVASGLLQPRLGGISLLAASGDAHSPSCCLLPSQAPFTTPLRRRTCTHQKVKLLCLSLQNLWNSIKWVSGLN